MEGRSSDSSTRDRLSGGIRNTLRTSMALNSRSKQVERSADEKGKEIFDFLCKVNGKNK